MKNLVYMACMVFLAFGGCNKSIEPDLCAGKSPTTAEFDAYEVYVEEKSRDKKVCDWCKYWINYPTDTMLNNYVTFIARQDSTPGTVYDWSIGAVKGNKKKIVVDFGNRKLNDNTIKVSLKVKTNPNPCYMADSGKASFSKNITILAPPPSPGGVPIDIDEMYTLSLRNSLLNGTFVGTYYAVHNPKAEEKLNTGKAYEGDTLIISLGDRKTEFCSSDFISAWYYFSDYRRNNLNANKNTFCETVTGNYFPLNDGIIFPGSIMMMRQIIYYEYYNYRAYLYPDRKTIEFKSFKDKLMFKGKRI